MLDVGWTELLVIGVVALLVIGPKDLPEMFRQLGRFTAKMRGMARDFQRAMDEAAKQAGVADVAKDLRNVTSPKSMGMDAMKSAADKFEKWDPIKNAAKPSVAPVTGAIKTGPLVPAPVPASLVAPNQVAPSIGGAEVGPATQALYEKQAAKAAAYKEYSAKLKSIDDGTTPVTPVAEAAAPTKAKSAAKAKTAAKPPVAKVALPDPEQSTPSAAAKPTRRSPAKKKTETP